MVELRPCPFCGGKAELEDLGWPHHVYCTACGARVTSILYDEEGDQEAIEKWNRRDELKMYKIGPFYVLPQDILKYPMALSDHAHIADDNAHI